MGGKRRPIVIVASALAVFAMSSPVALLAGPLAPHHAVASASDDRHHAAKDEGHGAHAGPAAAAPAPGGRSASPVGSSQPPAPAAAPVAAPAAGKPSGEPHIPGQIERARPREDHAEDESAVLPARNGSELGDAGAVGEPAASPAAAAQAAATPVVLHTGAGRAGGPPSPPPVIVEPPAAPQPNPPVAAAPQVLTGARLDWILVGVVIALAAAVVAAVRVAALRGTRPPR